MPMDRFPLQLADSYLFNDRINNSYSVSFTSGFHLFRREHAASFNAPLARDELYR